MSRLQVVDPAQATGRVKEIFEGPLKGKHLNIFKGLGNSPVGLDAYIGIAGALSKGDLTAADHEVIQLAISEENNCEYCVAAHTVIGKGAGLSEEQTIAARRGDDTGDARKNAIAAFARALHSSKGFVSDDDLAAFKEAGFSDAHVVEVLTTYALAIFTNYFNHVNQTENDFPAAPSAKTAASI